MSGGLHDMNRHIIDAVVSLEVISMSKYKCNDCEAEFNEPDTYTEYMGEFWGVPAYEEFGCCPVCKSDDYEEVSDYE